MPSFLQSFLDGVNRSANLPAAMQNRMVAQRQQEQDVVAEQERDRRGKLQAIDSLRRVTQMEVSAIDDEINTYRTQGAEAIRAGMPDVVAKSDAKLRDAMRRKREMMQNFRSTSEMIRGPYADLNIPAMMDEPDEPVEAPQPPVAVSAPEVPLEVAPQPPVESAPEAPAGPSAPADRLNVGPALPPEQVEDPAITEASPTLGSVGERIAVGVRKKIEDTRFRAGLPGARVHAKEHGVDAGLQYLREHIGETWTDEMEERGRRALEGYDDVGGGRVYNVDLDLGIGTDGNGEVRPLKGWKPPYGEMNGAQRDDANKQQSEFRQSNSVKMYGASQAGKARADVGYRTPNAAGDIALIYGFAKASAPDDSAVREGEFATMEEAMGWLEQKGIFVERSTDGRRLNEKARRKLYATTYAIYLETKRNYVKHAKEMAVLGETRGIKPHWFIPGWDTMNDTALQLRPTPDLIDIVNSGKGTDKIFGNPLKEEAAGELRRRFAIGEGEDLKAGLLRAKEEGYLQ